MGSFPSSPVVARVRSVARMASVARTTYRRSLWRLGDLWQTARSAPRVLLENTIARRPPRSLVILDDVFPLSWSGFRVAEFNAYLDAFTDADVHSTGDRIGALGNTGDFDQIVAAYEAEHPNYRGRIRRFHELRRLDQYHAAYSLFAATTRRYVPTLERSRVPFVFTLYPGGGFALDDVRSDATLRRIFDSKVFRKVIATQTITRDYLMARGLCDESRIEFVYGGVFRSAELTGAPVLHRRYAIHKETLDICFVAHKYVPQGKDKGYDRFIATAQLLAARFEDVRFHVVGPFGPTDVPVDGLIGRLIFHGSQPTSFFPRFYAEMDLIVSPNLPFILRKGAFDGFPTGSCMEAGMCGVAPFCTDALGLNVALQDGQDIVIIPPEPDQIADVISEFRASPERLARVGDSAATTFRYLFGVEHQMPPRLRVLSQIGTPRSSGAGNSY